MKKLEKFYLRVKDNKIGSIRIEKNLIKIPVARDYVDSDGDTVAACAFIVEKIDGKIEDNKADEYEDNGEEFALAMIETFSPAEKNKGFKWILLFV